MTLFLCFRAETLFLYFNELIFNILISAQKSYKIVRFVQKRTKTPFVRTADFCTKLVQILCRVKNTVYQKDARKQRGRVARLHKKRPMI